MKVSVILTSYNHEKYIAQSIESILNQTYEDFELLVYDDCSSDRSVAIISSYTDERIKLIASPFNRGTTLVKYLVENFVSGELVAVAHSDDFWEKDKLRKQVEYLKEHPKTAAVFTYVNVVDEEGQPYEDIKGFYYQIFEQENRSRFAWLHHFFYEGNCLCHPSVLIRKEAYAAYGMYTKGLRQLPDFYMWIRLCLHSEIHIIPERLTDFRIRRAEKNTSGFRKDSSIRSSVELNLILKQFLDLKRYEDFILVFPEAAEYAKPECFIVEYAFARVCLQEQMPGYRKLFGLQLLFGLLNDGRLSGDLEQQYQFTSRDFFALTGSYDIFGLYPFAEQYGCNLYYDCGCGYSEEYVLRRQYEWWQEIQQVDLDLDVRTLSEQKAVRMRFDPIEGALVRCRMISFRIDGQEKQWTPLNASAGGNEGDEFLTADPQYEYVLDTADIRQVQISFELQKLQAHEIARIAEEERKQARLEAAEHREETAKLKAELEYREQMFWKWKRKFGRDKP